MRLSEWTKIVVWLGLVALVVVASSSPAEASIVFDFNTLADEANNSSVQVYMQQVAVAAHPGAMVSVSGASAEKEYNANGYVTGPVTPASRFSGASVTSETLGTSDLGAHHTGAFDTFLVNRNAPTISLTFSFPVYSASFDYEIFPDALVCRDAAHCATPREFTFEANGQVQFLAVGQTPGTGGSFSHSPHSTAFANEATPQLLRQSGTIFFPNGATHFEFIDCPGVPLTFPFQIGIDNLRISDNVCDVPGHCRSPMVPEPVSSLLFGMGLLGGPFIPRKRRG